MNSSDTEFERWQRIAAELEAYRDDLQETWGGLEDVVLANYVAGSATREETIAVERAMMEKPAVRDLIKTVRASLAPVWAKQPAAHFNKTVQVLQERLRVWLDEAGRVASQGAEYLMRPALSPGIDMALDTGKDPLPGAVGSAPGEACWEIPVEELGVDLRIKATISTAGKWKLNFTLVGDVDPNAAERAWFSVSRAKGLPIVRAELSKFSGRFLEVDAGQWDITIELDDVVRVLPIAIGESPPGS